MCFLQTHTIGQTKKRTKVRRFVQEHGEIVKELHASTFKASGTMVQTLNLRSFFKTFCVNAGIPREVVDKWQDHAGDRRPTAGDLYYKLSDEDSQKFMKMVPFGTGTSTADADNKVEE